MIGQSMRHCQKDDHQAPWEDMYTYRDSTHGITRDIQICARCLLKHVRQYWPGSGIEKHMLDRHPEWRADALPELRRTDAASQPMLIQIARREI